MAIKKCTGCGIEKSLSKFYNQKKGRFGVTSKCKDCTKILYEEPKREERAKRFKIYYLENKEKFKLQSIAWRRDNKDMKNIGRNPCRFNGCG